MSSDKNRHDETFGCKNLGESGLRYFGQMSAANAHEIKNALAIINESAGLLGDLASMAEKGASLDPQRLKRLADQIQQQVARADDIAKSTNRFAHSVDKPHGPADLGQSLKLVITMAMRYATKRHIGIEVIYAKTTITLPVQPFRLLHLLWICLQCAMDATNAEKTIRVTMQRNKNVTTIRFGPLSHLEPSTVAAISATDEMIDLLKMLKARIEPNSQLDDLLLILEK